MDDYDEDWEGFVPSFLLQNNDLRGTGAEPLSP
jgi:hypothetical protein